MKALLLLLFSTSAFATGSHNPAVNVLQGQSQASSVEVDNERAPVSSAIAGSSNTTADCRYLQQNSLQLVVFGGTNTTMLRDLVCTLGKPLTDEQKLALCIESADYRKIRAHVGDECKVK